MRGSHVEIVVACIVLLLGNPAAHGLEFAGGTGAPDDPYQIATAEQLIGMGRDPNLYDKHFILVADIDFSKHPLLGDAVIAPYTCSLRGSCWGVPFTGSLDGNQHAIRNLAIQNAWGDHLGLFGNVGSGSRIHDLILVDVNIEGDRDCGGLAGINNGMITRCRVTGRLAIGSEVGLLVGRNAGTITHSHAEGTISGKRQSRSGGGLVGFNYWGGRIASCSAAVDVATHGWEFGGLVGRNSGLIMCCNATGNVTGVTEIGGLSGTSTGVIAHSCATTTVSGLSDTAGGLVGRNYGTLVQCFAAGSTDGGGLVGYAGYSQVAGRIENCFWDIEASGQPSWSGGGKGLATPRMHDMQTFLAAGWDFTGERANGTADLWEMPEGGGYPRLACLGDAHEPVSYAGAGTPDDPFQIATAEQLGAMGCHDWSACYRLTADIDLSGITWTTAPVWYFDGRLDGAGFILSNLTVRGGLDLGLFAGLGVHARVENLGIVDANITGGYDARRVAALAAYSDGGIHACYAQGKIAAGNSSECIAGLVGENTATGRVMSCYTGVVIEAGPQSGSLGALVARSAGHIANCYAMGSVCLVEPPPVEVSPSPGPPGRRLAIASTGVVASAGAGGGLIGVNEGTVTHCFWDTEASGLVASDGGTGLPTAQMMKSQTFSFSGWARDPNWIHDDGKDYPRLIWEGAAGQAIPEPVIDWLVGRGTAAEPFIISTSDQMALLGMTPALWNEIFVLAADVDLTGTKMSRIGICPGTGFGGFFFGNGHVVRGPALDAGETAAVNFGLFGCVDSGGRISDLGLENATIYVGAESHNIGLLVGLNRGVVTYAYARGAMLAGDESVSLGGLIGSNMASVTDCYAVCDIRTGGNSNGAGGLAGVNTGAITDCYASGTVGDSLDGEAVGTLILVGGNTGNVRNCYWNCGPQPLYAPSKYFDVQPLSDGQMRLRASFVGWDFLSVWAICEGKGYPRLRWEDGACEP